MNAPPKIAAKIVASVACVLIGVVFIFSGISKMPTLDQFGWTIVETTPLNWTMAEWSARLLIGLELFLGVLFITHLRLRKIAIPLSSILLLVFTVYLLLVIKVYGSSGNCGCFGEMVQMTPLESVYKNIAMLVLIALIAFLRHEWQFRFDRWVVSLIFLLTVLLPFFIKPPESIYIYDKEKDVNEPIPLSILYQSTVNKAPTEDLRKGKHVIAFMSPSCQHCRKAAIRMRIMKEKHPELPFFVVLNGDSISQKPFFEATKMNNIPYIPFTGAEQFAEMNGGYSFPTIKFVKDTTVIREKNYLTLDEKEIIDWMQQP